MKPVALLRDRSGFAMITAVCMVLMAVLLVAGKIGMDYLYEIQHEKLTDEAIAWTYMNPLGLATGDSEIVYVDGSLLVIASNSPVFKFASKGSGITANFMTNGSIKPFLETPLGFNFALYPNNISTNITAIFSNRYANPSTLPRSRIIFSTRSILNTNYGTFIRTNNVSGAIYTQSLATSLYYTIQATISNFNAPIAMNFTNTYRVDINTNYTEYNVRTNLQPKWNYSVIATNIGVVSTNIYDFTYVPYFDFSNTYSSLDFMGTNFFFTTRGSDGITTISGSMSLASMISNHNSRPINRFSVSTPRAVSNYPVFSYKENYSRAVIMTTTINLPNAETTTNINSLYFRDDGGLFWVTE